MNPALTVGLPVNIVAAMQQIRQGWQHLAPFEEYFMQQACAHCLRDMSGQTVPRLYMNGWYSERDNLLLYYWLCPDCSKRAIDPDLLQTVAANTLQYFYMEKQRV
jgi:hypothetical protein